MTEPELIEAREVAEILQVSIPSLRDYRKRGLIIVAAKRGQHGFVRQNRCCKTLFNYQRKTPDRAFR